MMNIIRILKFAEDLIFHYLERFKNRCIFSSLIVLFIPSTVSIHGSQQLTLCMHTYDSMSALNIALIDDYITIIDSSLLLGAELRL